jgi:hypothetical protein
MPLLSRVFFLSVHSKRANGSRLLDLWKTKLGGENWENRSHGKFFVCNMIAHASSYYSS